MTSWNERNKAVIEEFRTHGGKVKGWAPLMLLTTTGAKTGQTRIAPLMLVTDGDRLLAVAVDEVKNILREMSDHSANCPLERAALAPPTWANYCERLRWDV